MPNREDFRHIEAFEIGFDDFVEQCLDAPVCRVYGRVELLTAEVGRLVRFNRTVLVIPQSKRLVDGLPAVDAFRLRRQRDGSLKTLGMVTIRWEELRYVTWMTDAGRDPNGHWCKVTVENSLGAICPHCGQRANAHYSPDLRIVA
jgi:hypothetical protein